MKKNVGFDVSAFVMSHIGKLRTNHQDNFLFDNGQHIVRMEQEQMSLNKYQYIKRNFSETVITNGFFAVSDGMGGHNSGEIASNITMRQIIAMRDYIFRTHDVDGIRDRFQDFIRRTNSIIVMKANEALSLKGMGTTLTGLIICGEGVMCFNVGDSRVYHLQHGNLVQITKDHTEKQRLLDLGLIKEDESQLIEGGKSITRYLGIDNPQIIVQADISDVINIDDTNYFMICSDGLSDVVPLEEMNQIINNGLAKTSPQVVVEQLVERALTADHQHTNGGCDNITVMLVKISPHIRDRFWKLKHLLMYKELREIDKY